jgi:hypothetical protein
VSKIDCVGKKQVSCVENGLRRSEISGVSKMAVYQKQAPPGVICVPVVCVVMDVRGLFNVS